MFLAVWAVISIHALLAESDVASLRFFWRRFRYFYPRSPCGERRITTTTICIVSKFLSTLSLRRATGFQLAHADAVTISIHALLAESDGIGLVFMWWGVRFLSTLSLRRATAFRKLAEHVIADFYPRSPCGERPPNIFLHCTTYLFLSTLSLRRATRAFTVSLYPSTISIHALLAESDGCFGRFAVDSAYFYPRSPCGERR